MPETFRSTNRPKKPKRMCKRHPRVPAAQGKDLCGNCLSADALGARMAKVNDDKKK